MAAAVGRVAEAVLIQPNTIVVTVLAAGPVQISPQQSQSPAVWLRDVILVGVVVADTETAAPARTTELMNSPIFPALALSSVVLPGIWLVAVYVTVLELVTRGKVLVEGDAG